MNIYISDISVNELEELVMFLEKIGGPIGASVTTVAETPAPKRRGRKKKEENSEEEGLGYIPDHLPLGEAVEACRQENVKYKRKRIGDRNGKE